MNSPRVKRALISVSDKLGLLDFARGLQACGVEIYSTGGTRRHLETGGVNVIDVASYTGFPEMLDGRVKTLHPKIFAGILARPSVPGDVSALEDHDILPFELVVVNLYPFEATIARENVTRDEAIEQIDIGGPSLVRAAAKNHRFVSIATRPGQYSQILDQIEQNGCTSEEHRRVLMAEAFAHTAAYDRAITSYFMRDNSEGQFPGTLSMALRRKSELRYGENPHQRAAVYTNPSEHGPSLVSARQINGKELSYNNILDLDAALSIVRMFVEPAAVVIKHNNPCGAAVGKQLADAAGKALDGDPLSAFGSVLGFNRTVDVATAELLAEPGRFIEAIVAPDFEAAAVGILTTKPKWKNNVRLMQVGRLDKVTPNRQFRHIEGGMLVQDADTGVDNQSEWKVVTENEPSEALMKELRFAWTMVRPVKSNAIVLARDESLVGAGAGQMSRVDAVDIAIHKAGDRADGAVLASDAFFPFADSIEKAAKAGIAAIIQPGGSRNDEEVIEACDDHGIPMIFTGCRHFRH